MEAIPGLPNDFTFHALTKAGDRVDVATLFPTFDYNQLRDHRQAFLTSSSSPDDSVRGLRGSGLNIDLEFVAGELGKNAKARMYWKPEPFACYRDGLLLGIWDPAERTFRSAQSEEAKPVIVSRSFFDGAVSKASDASGQQPPVPIVGTPKIASYGPHDKLRVRDYLDFQGTGAGERDATPESGTRFVILKMKVEGDQTLAIQEYLGIDQDGAIHKPIAVRFSGKAAFIGDGELAEQIGLSHGPKDKLSIKDFKIVGWLLSAPQVDLLYECPDKIKLRYLQYGNDRYGFK